MSFLHAVADVLEKLAADIEAAPSPVVAKAAAAPVLPPVVTEAVKHAAERTAAAYGKPVSTATATKVANDPELLAVIDKVATERSRPAPMGGPAEEKTAAKGTDDRRDKLSSAFDNWGSAIARNG